MAVNWAMFVISVLREKANKELFASILIVIGDFNDICYCFLLV